MRYHSLVLLVCVLSSFETEAQRSWSSDKKNSCLFVEEPDRSGRPDWDDERLFTEVGPHEIIKEAAVKAYQRLSYCRKTSNLVKLLSGIQMMAPGTVDAFKSSFGDGTLVQASWAEAQPTGNEMGRLVRRYSAIDATTVMSQWDPLTVRDPNGNLKLRIVFDPIQAQYNLAGRVESNVNFTECPFRDYDGYHWYCCGTLYGAYERSDGFMTSNFQGTNGRSCYKEVYDFKIHVFPQIFITRELWIPTENRWARNAVEATMYVILHELAHAERYIGTESGLKWFSSFGGADEEKDAWAYASSVIRASVDLLNIDDY